MIRVFAVYIFFFIAFCFGSSCLAQHLESDTLAASIVEEFDFKFSVSGPLTELKIHCKANAENLTEINEIATLLAEKLDDGFVLPQSELEFVA
jgi:hypothetical protein